MMFKHVYTIQPDLVVALQGIAATLPWDWLKLRTSMENSAHHAVNDCILRFHPVDKPLSFQTVMDSLECVDYFPMHNMPSFKELLSEFAKVVGENPDKLGRVIFTALVPGGSIDEHADEGGYAEATTRYHVVVLGEAGSTFTCGDEQVEMRTGEVWWFNHREPHAVFNNSTSPRIHLIIDFFRDEDHV
jgi:quercetin dioxygenase-like cupin family protein